MAVGEAKKQVKNGNIITQVSWTWWTTQDVYYWQANSFQYASNINTDDELHGIKLSTKWNFINAYEKCQLTSLWDKWVMALPVDTRTSWDEKLLKRFQFNWVSSNNPREDLDTQAGTTYSYKYDSISWVVFQDRYWFGSNRTAAGEDWKYLWYITSLPLDWDNVTHGSEDQKIFLPYDHPDYTDESIEDATNILLPMKWAITAILNYNNTRLVVACGSDLWVYYPELDHWAKDDNMYWVQWWKKVLSYEAWVIIVALTCTFEYLKVRAVDEWWNTKVYYYQGNNDLRNTFVYNLVDLTWVRVTRVYSINGIDYYVSSLDGTDGFVNLYKLVWTTPVELFKQRAWLDPLDINTKAPYFVWPVWLDAAYSLWKFYIADAYGLFQFTYTPNGIDTWYMKRWLYNNKQVYWVCENQWYLYVSTADGCYAMRVWDTWIDHYQDKWVLISRELEWREWWTVTKMLDEARINFELNPNVRPSSYWSNTQPYWTIDIYVSPNNLWKSTSEFTLANNWYHVISITKDSAWTRTEKSNLFNDLNSWESAFKFDWQTITYAIVINRWIEPKVTPIVREIKMTYHCKDKTNNVYDIN